MLPLTPSHAQPDPAYVVITGSIRSEDGRPLAAHVLGRPFSETGPEVDRETPESHAGDLPGWVESLSPLDSFQSTRAGDDGHFELRIEFARTFHAAEGCFGPEGILGELAPWLLVRHPGFLPVALHDARGPSVSNRLSINVGRIVLRQAATLRGRLLSKAGRPIPDTDIWLPNELKPDSLWLVQSIPRPSRFGCAFGSSSPSFRRVGHLAYVTRTDLDGRFELAVPESRRLWLECAPGRGTIRRHALGKIVRGAVIELGDLRSEDALQRVEPVARIVVSKIVHSDWRVVGGAPLLAPWEDPDWRETRWAGIRR